MPRNTLEKKNMEYIHGGIRNLCGTNGQVSVFIFQIVFFIILLVFVSLYEIHILILFLRINEATLVLNGWNIS